MNDTPVDIMTYNMAYDWVPFATSENIVDVNRYFYDGQLHGGAGAKYSPNQRPVLY